MPFLSLMLQDYPTTRRSRACHASGSLLRPGEDYVSALVNQGNQLIRMDFAASAWKGPPKDSVGWWRCRMPIAAQTRLRPAPDGVLIDALTELLHNPRQSDLAYLLSLYLVRRRVLTESVEDNTTLDHWHLTTSIGDRAWRVPIAMPSNPDDQQRLQRLLIELLFADEPCDERGDHAESTEQLIARERTDIAQPSHAT